MSFALAASAAQGPLSRGDPQCRAAARGELVRRQRQRNARLNTGQGGLTNSTPTNATPGEIPLIQTPVPWPEPAHRRSAPRWPTSSTRWHQHRCSGHRARNKGSDPPACRAQPDGALRRYRPVPGRRRISGADRPTSANGIVTPTIDFKPFGSGCPSLPPCSQRHHQSAHCARGEPARLHNAVTISGTTIPALVTRNALTTVELRDGQSFAIAGLLQADDLRIGSDSMARLGSGSRHSVQQQRAIRRTRPTSLSSSRRISSSRRCPVSAWQRRSTTGCPATMSIFS